MKLALVITLLGLSGMTYSGNDHIFSVLANRDKPFVSQNAAGAIAKTVVEDYYGKELFVVRDVSVETTAQGYRVTLHNMKASRDNLSVMSKLTIYVSPENGRISLEGSQ